jgi:hypothetical protein
VFLSQQTVGLHRHLNLKKIAIVVTTNFRFLTLKS